jgi:hypothetical protein
MNPANSRIHPEFFLHDACLPEEMKAQPVSLSPESIRLRPAEVAEIKALVTEMRKYIIYHGLLIGECVAWNKLKSLFGVGEEPAEMQVGPATYIEREYQGDESGMP